MRRILFPLLLAVLFSGQLAAQSRQITGRVSDADAPIANATVLVKGTNWGTSTGPEGNFSLTLPPNARALVISAIGYVTKEVNITASNVYAITLEANVTEETEVIVTGLNRQRRSEYAGAASKVTAGQLRNVPIGSFDQLLQGRAAGLTVFSSGGQPGSSANVILRGPTSISGGSNPLYIMDGVPIEAETFQSINPNDIASVDVLKDATAAALYGSRGAAGVIVITTKRGTSGKMKLGYSTQYGTKFKPDFKYRMMSSAELLQAQEDYGLQVPTLSRWGTFPSLPGWQYSRKNPYKNTGTVEPKTDEDFAFGDRQLDSLRAIDVYWLDQFIDDGNFMNNEISFSGGTGKTRLYTNLGYYNEEGINKPSDMKRITLRTNMDYADDKLTFAFSSNIGFTRRNFQANTLLGYNDVINPFGIAQLTPSYISPKLPNDSFNVGLALPFIGPTMLDKIANDKVYNDQLKGVLSLSLNYDFTKNIYGGVVAGLDFRETQNTTYNDPRTFDTRNNSNIRTKTGSMSEALNRYVQLTGRTYAGYRNVFDNDHSIDVTVYGEYIREFNKAFSGTGYGIDPRRPNTIAAITAGNATNQLFQSVTGTRSQRSVQSLLGTARYSFQQKYTVTGSFRYDGVSSLPEQNRTHTFYSVGAIWEASRENFLAGVRNLDLLRVKFSYGQSANADNFPFGDFGYLASYNTQANLRTGLTGIIPVEPGNPEADWEYTNTANIGIEFGLFGNRLYGDIQLYDKKTKNLFANLRLSATSGFGEQMVNAGSMYNRGIEYNLNFDVIKTVDFSWSVNVNGAYNKNKVTSLGNASSFEDGTELIKVGLPLGSHYEVKWAGVDAATGAPLYYDIDGKLTNVYSADNRVQDYGTWIPPYTGGFGTNLRYKRFDFSAFFAYAAKAYRVNNLEFFVENPGFLGQGVAQANSLDFWKEPGDIAATQSPLYQANFSSKLIQDASWLRLRNITLAYSLPGELLSRTKVFSDVRVYVLGQNLITWTKWKGLDPEDDNNISLTEYPNPRTITVGLDIKF